MKIPSFFRRRRSVSRKNTPAKGNNGENGSPKNGWLALAVVGVFGLMIFLVGINARLLLSPAAPGKRSAPSDHPRSEFGYPAGANVASTPQDKICAHSLAIAVDSERNAPKEPKSGRHDESTHPIRKADSKKASPEAESAFPKKDTITQKSKSVAKKETSSALDEARYKQTPQTHAKRSSEKPNFSSKMYTVQVGAFTNPQTAQQQARRWKSMGYDVVLRPMAMPKSGVIYRLYLGSFKSAKEADDLVKDLKTKGFTCFRLMVSN